MRKLLSGIITAAVLGLMAWSALKGPGEAEQSATEAPDEVIATSPGQVGDDPYAEAEASVRDLLASAKKGDVEAYLKTFDDPMRARLRQEVAERGREAFAARLREAAGARKSHAVFAPEPDGPDRAQVTVEAVYPDRNERQTFWLRREREEDAWLVAEVETIRARQPETKFGTPASFEAPEAPPAMAGPDGSDPLAMPGTGPEG